LKSLFHAPAPTELQPAIEAFLVKYHEERGLQASQKTDLDSRTARLLPMLLLARMDGKSPVEYLSDSKRDFVRNFVRSGLPSSRLDLHHVISTWFSTLHLQWNN